MTLWEYVRDNAIRGECTCGRCVDTTPNPEDCQPKGHTVDMVFFKVAKKEEADAEIFLSLIKDEFPQWLDGEEHNYIQMGGEIGDQGLAIMTIAIGHLLGVWQALTPALLGIPKELQTQMAGMGMLSMKVIKKDPIVAL